MVNNVNLWETFVILCLKAKLTWSYADGLFRFFDHSSVEIKEISFREILKDWNSKRAHCLSKKCVMNTTANMYGETKPVWSQKFAPQYSYQKMLCWDVYFLHDNLFSSQSPTNHYLYWSSPWLMFCRSGDSISLQCLLPQTYKPWYTSILWKNKSQITVRSTCAPPLINSTALSAYAFLLGSLLYNPTTLIG